jgi:hypothetical protein
MRQQQNQQGKQKAAGIETPGKKQSGSEHCNVVEAYRRRNLDKQRTVDKRRRQRQQEGARDKPCLPGSPMH